MKKLPALCILIIVICSLAYGDATKNQDLTDKVAGTWKSLDQAKGESQAVLTIKKVENKLTGSFVFRGLTINGQENSSVELSLTDVIFDGTTLTFKATFPEPEKVTTEWALTLRSDNEAKFDMTREAGKPIEDAPSFVMKRAKSN
jgi:hypothetical protein